MFTAIRGEGAFLNGERLAGQRRDRRRPDGDRHRHADHQPLHLSTASTRGSNAIRRPIGTVTIVGSSANSCAYVACGRLTGYFEESGLVDTAVGMLLVEEAGRRRHRLVGPRPGGLREDRLRHRRQPGNPRLPSRQAEERPDEEPQTPEGDLKTMSKLRVGVIGGGLVAQVEHLPNLIALPDLFDVVGVADPSAKVRTPLPSATASRPSTRRGAARRAARCGRHRDARLLPRRPHRGGAGARPARLLRKAALLRGRGRRARLRRRATAPAGSCRSAT